MRMWRTTHGTPVKNPFMLSQCSHSQPFEYLGVLEEGEMILKSGCCPVNASGKNQSRELPVLWQPRSLSVTVQWPSIIRGRLHLNHSAPGNWCHHCHWELPTRTPDTARRGWGTADKIQGRWHPNSRECWGFRPASSTWNCTVPPARHKSWDSCLTTPTEHHLCLLWLLRDSVFDLLALNTTFLHNRTHRYKFEYFFLDRQ